MKKKILVTGWMLCISLLTFGQIKIVDNIEVKLDNIDVLNKPIDMDKVFPKGIWLDGTQNPIGERYFNIHDIGGLRINRDSGIIERLILPQREYYTVTGVVIGRENCDSLYRIIAECPSFKEKDYLEKMSVKSFVTWDRVKSIDDYKNGVCNFSSLVGLFKLKRDGDEFNEYYIYPIGGSYPEYKYQYPYITEIYPRLLSVSAYEEIIKNFKGQKIMIETHERRSDGRRSDIFDYATGHKLTDIRTCDILKVLRKTESAYFDYTCTDVVLKDKILIMVLENEQNKFTLPIKCIDRNLWETGEYEELCATLDISKRSLFSGTMEIDNGKLKYTNEIIRLIAQSFYNELILSEQQKEVARKTAQQKQAAIKRQQEQLRRQRVIAKYGEIFGNSILNNQVAIGMTTEMCKDAWGTPYDRIKTTTAGAVKEQWLYGGAYLYFTNNKLQLIKTW